MSKRPRAITVIGGLFILVGCTGIVAGLRPLVHEAAAQGVAGIAAHSFVDLAYVSASGLLAVASGVYTLRGSQWGRWLVALWMGFHLILSVLHSSSALLVHCLLFAPVLYFLFRRSSAAYFRDPRPALP